MTSRPPSLRKRNSVSGRPCIVLPSLVGIGTNGTHSPASLGSKPTASSSKTWFSGRARVVSYDHGLYRYYITPLSAIYLLCPSPRLSILYCGIYVSRVEEIRILNCLISFILSCICEGIWVEFLGTKDLYLPISYVSRQCGPQLEPVPFRGGLISPHGRATSTRSAQIGSE